MKNSTEKRFIESKKFMAMAGGVFCASVIFGFSLAAMIFTPNGKELAPHIVSLAETILIFLGTLVSVVITGQSAVDWRHTSALSAVFSDEKKSVFEKIEMDIKQKNELIEQYKEKYADDESYKPVDPEEMWK